MTSVGAPRVAGASRWLLAVVLLLALGLRVTGLNWGLPWPLHLDEVVYVGPARHMLESGNLNPKYFRNPSLFTYLIAAQLLVARSLGPLVGPLAADTPELATLLARLDSALLGTGTVALAYATGRVLFGRRVGLLGALLLAVAFLHVRDSHFGVSDVPATALLALSLYASARLLREPAPRWYLLAGLAGGLATSTKYNMGLFFVPLLVAHWLGRPRAADGRHRASRGLPRSLAPLALAGVTAILTYLVGTPFTVLDFARFRTDFLTQYGFGNTRWVGQPADPVPLLYVATLLQGFGAMPLVLALVGFALACRRRRAEAALLVAFPVAYLGFMLPKPLFFARFALPLLPSLSLLAAYGVVELAAQLASAARWVPGTPDGRRWLKRPVLVGLAAVAMVQPMMNDLLHDRLLLQTNTRVLATEWALASLPPGSALGVESRSLVDRATKDDTSYLATVAGLRIDQFEAGPQIEDPRYFLDRGLRYVVTSSFDYERWLASPQPNLRPRARSYERLHRGLEQRAELVARFAPGHSARDVPYHLDDMMTPFWGLNEYERPGPTIHVYSLAPLVAGSGSADMPPPCGAC